MSAVPPLCLENGPSLSPCPYEREAFLSFTSLRTDKYWVSFTMAMIMVPPIKVQVGQNKEWKTATWP